MDNPLSQIPLFAGLPAPELDALLRTMKVVELAPDEVLFREGEVGEHLYVVAGGEVDVLRGAGSPGELRLHVARPGEYFGDMALLMPGGQRTATVRARTRATLRVLGRAGFDDLLGRFPLLAYAMVRVLSQRLDASNSSAFRELTEKNRQLQQAYDELKAAHVQIVEKERLEKELSVAADIQLSILPDTLPDLDTFEFGATIEPARKVGGDFYDVFRLDDEHVAVLIGDVADKGVPSAIYMARVHALIIAESDRSLDPGTVLRVVNARITRLERSAQFVTVLYGVLDTRTGEFRYARAGHQPPTLLSPRGDVICLPHSAGMAIGAWDDIRLDERAVQLEPDSVLLLYTDGLTDCRNPAGEPFGTERVGGHLARMIGRPARGVCEGLNRALHEFRQGAVQDDDVTLVAVRAAASVPQ